MIQRDLGDGTYANYDEQVPPPVSKPEGKPEGKLIIQGAEGQAREFVITSAFTSSGRYMEFTATAVGAGVDYRMLIERVS